MIDKERKKYQKYGALKCVYCRWWQFGHGDVRECDGLEVTTCTGECPKPGGGKYTAATGTACAAFAPNDYIAKRMRIKR